MSDDEQVTAPRPRGAPRAAASAGVLTLAILAVAVNQRPGIVVVGPLLDQIRAGTGLSTTGLAVLTAMPVVCFGVVGLFGGRVITRWGIRPTIVASLLVLAAGSLVRLAPGTPALLLGTVVAAAGIAVLNVGLPAAVKAYLPTRLGRATGLYATALGVAAAAAAAVAVPLSGWLGWRGALGVWAVPALLAALWWSSLRTERPAGGVTVGAPSSAAVVRRLARSAVAWQVTAFLALQSATFYSVMAYLPSVYVDQGYDAAGAGTLLGVLTFTGVPVALVVPPTAARVRRPELLALGLSVASVVGLAGTVLAPGAVLLWAVVAGIGLGGNFPLALTFVAMRASDAHAAASLSAMAQGIGYLVAAAGPVLMGVLHAATGDWTVPIAMLVAFNLTLIPLGWGASRPVHAL